MLAACPHERTQLLFHPSDGAIAERLGAQQLPENLVVVLIGTRTWCDPGVNTALEKVFDHCPRTRVLGLLLPAYRLPYDLSWVQLRATQHTPSGTPYSPFNIPERLWRAVTVGRAAVHAWSSRVETWRDLGAWSPTPVPPTTSTTLDWRQHWSP